MRIAALLLLVACGTNETPQPTDALVLPSCVPNRDGQITADELPIAFGAQLDYYVSTNIGVALTGSVIDLSQERATDTRAALGPQRLGAQWYAASFPNGQFAVDAGSGLDGIYHQDDRALWLDGTASQAESPKTLIRYPDPIAVVRFPVVDADAFTSTGQITDGVISDLPFIGSDKVDIDVTAIDRLDVPYVQFSPVMRVREHVTRTPSTGTPVVTRRTTIFLFECFGEVARAESNQDEPNPDFTTAAYLRRYRLGDDQP
jgi:hypothetical protein